MSKADHATTKRAVERPKSMAQVTTSHDIRAETTVDALVALAHFLPLLFDSHDDLPSECLSSHQRARLDLLSLPSTSANPSGPLASWQHLREQHRRDDLTVLRTSYHAEPDDEGTDLALQAACALYDNADDSELLLVLLHEGGEWKLHDLRAFGTVHDWDETVEEALRRGEARVAALADQAGEQDYWAGFDDDPGDKASRDTGELQGRAEDGEAGGEQEHDYWERQAATSTAVEQRLDDPDPADPGEHEALQHALGSVFDLWTKGVDVRRMDGSQRRAVFARMAERVARERIGEP